MDDKNATLDDWKRYAWDLEKDEKALELAETRIAELQGENDALNIAVVAYKQVNALQAKRIAELENAMRDAIPSTIGDKPREKMRELLKGVE